MKAIFSSLKLSALAAASILFLSTQAFAHDRQFVYETVCQPVEMSDIARVIRGHIWLSLREHKSVTGSKVIYVGIRKADTEKTWVSENNLLRGLNFSFNPADLSISIGGRAEGHACYANATLLFDVQVYRKNGDFHSNQLQVPVRIPGSLATKAKYIEGEGGR